LPATAPRAARSGADRNRRPATAARDQRRRHAPARARPRSRGRAARRVVGGTTLEWGIALYPFWGTNCAWGFWGNETRSEHARVRSCHGGDHRSEEHTSELQSRGHLVCRLLLEKKKKQHSIQMLFIY